MYLTLKFKTHSKVYFFSKEIHYDLTSLCADSKKDLLRKIFEKLKFSFYILWKPCADTIDAFETVRNYFGHERIVKCLNRYEYKSMKVNRKQIEKNIENREFKVNDEWDKALNLIGCLINNVEM